VKDIYFCVDKSKNQKVGVLNIKGSITTLPIKSDMDIEFFISMVLFSDELTDREKEYLIMQMVEQAV